MLKNCMLANTRSGTTWRGKVIFTCCMSYFGGDVRYFYIYLSYEREVEGFKDYYR